VSTSWASEEYYPTHAKEAIRDIMLRGLSDVNQQMRNIFAYVIAKIAEEDFPAKWPGLLDHLIRSLESDCAYTRDGATKSFSELMKSASDFNSQQVKRFLLELMPKLYRMFANNKNIDDEQEVKND
jgi:ribosomal protein L16 Arg81 hydroxylase